jgi:endonuclease G
VRDLVEARGEAWVVTGVLFQGDHISTTPDGRVMVPTSFWKAVALPDGQAAVFLAPNAPSGKIRSVSLEEFRQRTGIVPSPR